MDIELNSLELQTAIEDFQTVLTAFENNIKQHQLDMNADVLKTLTHVISDSRWYFHRRLAVASQNLKIPLDLLLQAHCSNPSK
jgi:hypothetical protein